MQTTNTPYERKYAPWQAFGLRLTRHGTVWYADHPIGVVRRDPDEDYAAYDMQGRMVAEGRLDDCLLALCPGGCHAG